jgi:aminopeptidase N
MAPSAEKPVAIYRKDYKPPSYLVDSIHLNFILNEDVTRVESTLRLQPNFEAAAAGAERPPLFLNGVWVASAG